MKQNKLTRYAIACAALVGALFLSGCSPKVVDFRNVEISNGKIYERGANKGFTGKLTNLPDKRLIKEGGRLVSFMGPVDVVLKNTPYIVAFYTNYSLCDVGVRDGVLHGEVTCSAGGAKALRYKMTFEDGLLDGAFKLYDFTPENNVVASANFKADRLSGKQEIFSPKTQKLMYRTNWEKGVMEREEVYFDENTGNLIAQYEYKNGKWNGDYVQYAPDGKSVIYRSAFLAGVRHGVEEKFDPATGKPRLYAEWVNGVRSEAAVKEWDSSGEALSRAPGAPSSSQIDECVDRWTYVFRKEQGPEAAVSIDQMGEWESWCKQGKKPG